MKNIFWIKQDIIFYRLEENKHDLQIEEYIIKSLKPFLNYYIRLQYTLAKGMREDTKNHILTVIKQHSLIHLETLTFTRIVQYSELIMYGLCSTYCLEPKCTINWNQLFNDPYYLLHGAECKEEYRHEETLLPPPMIQTLYIERKFR